MRRKFTWAAAGGLALVLAAAGLAVEAAPVLEKARRGVVTILAMGGVPRKPGTVPFFQEEASESSVLGSGIILSEDGLILTANHVIEGAGELSAVVGDMGEFRATVKATEPALDIAVLSIPATGLSPLPWRIQSGAQVGEVVFSIGTPAVFSMDPEPSVSRGIVSAVHRTLETTGHPEPAFLMDLIETDAQISPGESGGALVDRDGMLLGMCLAVYHPDAGIRGKAFALPADLWLRAGIDEMTARKRFPIGSLGMDVAPLGIEAARGLPVAPRQGVFVAWPPRGGPSDTAGIKPGDAITGINGEAVTSVSQLRRIEMRLAPGSTAKVQAARRGLSKALEFAVRVGGQKEPVSAALLRFDWRGMALSDIDDALRKAFNAPSRKGVIVVEIRRAGNAYKAGLRKGDVIREINNTTVDSLAAFKQAVESIPDSNVVRVRTTDGVGHIQGGTPKG